MAVRNSLQSQLASSRAVAGWCQAMQLQNKYFSFLESLPELLPANSYLNRLSLDRNELILEGTLLSSSEESLKKFIHKITSQHRFAIKQRQIEGVRASEQKFLISFVCLRKN